MGRRAAGAVIGAIVLLATLLLVYLRNREPEETPVEALDTSDTTTVVPSDGSAQSAVALYFPNQDGTLSAEARALGSWSEPQEGARMLAEAILAGPLDEALVAPLPAGTSLGVSHLTAASHLYIDLVSTEHTRPPMAGSQTELMAVYSLVDTILLNVPELEAVILMWNGRQLPTFAGHLDTSLPLRADPDLIEITE